MKHIMSKKMFDTNTEDGIKRYLSVKGFDVNRKIEYEPGPTKHLTCAVQEDLVVENRVEVIKKRAKKLKKSKN